MTSLLSRAASARLRLTVRISFTLLIVVAVTLPYLSLSNLKATRISTAKSVASFNKKLLVEKFKQPGAQFALENTDRWKPYPDEELVGFLPLPNLPSRNPIFSLALATGTGCTMTYLKGKLCIGAAARNSIDGAVYIVGSFVGPRNTAFGNKRKSTAGRSQTNELEQANRIFMTIRMESGSSVHLILPMQIRSDRTAHIYGDDLAMSAYLASADKRFLGDQIPVKSVEAIVWEEPCASPGIDTKCMRRTLFSIKINEGFFRAAPFALSGSIAGRLGNVRVKVEVLSPGPDMYIFRTGDNAAIFQTPIKDIFSSLQPGDELRIWYSAKAKWWGSSFARQPQQSRRRKSAVWGLPSDSYAVDTLHEVGRHALSFVRPNFPNAHEERVEIPATFHEGTHAISILIASPEMEDALIMEAGRTVVISFAILLAVIGAWIAIERGVVLRVLKLTKRAAQLSSTVREDGDIERFDFARYGGQDEIGILATALDALLARVSKDIRKQKLRLINEKDTLHAIGHEIRSPLQALSALHPNSDDVEQRYIARMMRAINALYGGTSPIEAFGDVMIDEVVFDLSSFLKVVADNAPYSNIQSVVLIASEPVKVKVDPSALEAVLEHLLTNADHFRKPNTSIDLSLRRDGSMAVVIISNQGPHIPSGLISSIFEYGVSSRQHASDATGRGQGLFVARTFLGRMGSAIEVRNTELGVEFEIRIPSFD